MYLFGACSLLVTKLAHTDRKREIFYFNKNGKFKFQTDIDRHGPRPLHNQRHLLNPLSFHCTLQCTFKVVVSKQRTTGTERGNALYVNECERTIKK
jgi:hypothetical protein